MNYYLGFIWFVLFWVLIALMVFAWPTWPHTRGRDWGYGPSGAAAGLALVLLLLFWFGLITVWWPGTPY